MTGCLPARPVPPTRPVPVSPSGTRPPRDYLRLIGVPEIAPATCPFDPGYDPFTFEGHLAPEQPPDGDDEDLHGLLAGLQRGRHAPEGRRLRRATACRTVTGGGPFEIAVQQGQLPVYLDLVADIGVTRIEAGEGFTDMPARRRPRSCAMARERGLEVQFELGKKHEGAFTPTSSTVSSTRAGVAGRRRPAARDRSPRERAGRRPVRRDRAASTPRTPIGSPMPSGLATAIFEAPNKPSQFALLNHFGRDVHLCNIRLEEMLRVEIYRRGLHSDAFEHDNLRPAR